MSLQRGGGGSHCIMLAAVLVVGFLSWMCLVFAACLLLYLCLGVDVR